MALRFYFGLGKAAPTAGKQSVTRFSIASSLTPSKEFTVNAIIVPQVTCDLPVLPITSKRDWTHLENPTLADPDYDKPGRVDLLLGAETFVAVIRHGRWSGPQNSPTALETEFGWVLAGSAGSSVDPSIVTSHHVSILTGDDILR